jgi:1,2-diacylglycerol 3-beta-glucosyltransferase
MTWLATTAVVLLALPVVSATLYLALLAALSRRVASPTAGVRTRFDIIVPAHNESAGILATIESLLGLDYPPEFFRTLVMADNCTDNTAAIAAAAGARVLERLDATRRGKGYALEHAYAVVLAEAFADAVVVIDADTVVSPNLLRAFSARFERGASAVQAEYAVRNPLTSWRTRLMVVALSLFHTLRSLGRETMRVSCGLRGNGMGFTCALLGRVPHGAHSLVEDVEYGIALGVAGIRVEYVAEALVFGEMAATATSARSQRERWERGRWAMAQSHLPALWRAWRNGGGRIPLDLAADLLVPPLTTLVVAVGLGVGFSSWAYTRGSVSVVAPAAWMLAALCLTTYVWRGIILAGLGAGVVRDLAWAPVYAAWKLMLLFRRRGASTEWIRTPRLDETLPRTSDSHIDRDA